MTEQITTLLQQAPVVPLVQSDDPETAVMIAKALVHGGLSVIEVVLRTDAALKCLEAIVEALPHAEIGAGTVLSTDHAREVIKRGAKFIVTPGLGESVVHLAQEANLPIFPGVATATELQQAWNLGVKTVKLFPASLSGGPAMIKALSPVFRDVKFMPTGGVSEQNLSEYLAIPSVIACGGSWLTPASAIQAGDYEKISTLAQNALLIAQNSK